MIMGDSFHAHNGRAGLLTPLPAESALLCLLPRPVLQLVRGTGGRVGVRLSCPHHHLADKGCGQVSTLTPSGLSRLDLSQQDQSYCKTLILSNCTPNFLQTVIDLNARPQMKTELVDLCIFYGLHTQVICLFSFEKRGAVCLLTARVGLFSCF